MDNSTRTQFNVKLSKAERAALRILASYGDFSMGEYVREQAIIAAWNARFPGVPLGRDPQKHQDTDERE